jgi:hypothetical protein
MSESSARPLTLAVVPCPASPKAFRWVIHARDGAAIERSPYAFTTAGGALISGRCWMREIVARGS